MARILHDLPFRATLCLFIFFFAVSCSDDDTEPDPEVTTPTLTTLPVSNITSNAAQSGGNITDDGGADVTARGIVWGESQNPALDDNEGHSADGTGTGTFNSVMDGLLPLTTYHVRAYATNSEGTSYGTEMMFETLSDDDDDNGDDDNDESDIIFGDGVTDIDDNEYETVIIGEQEWMAHNLRTTKYNNGNEILTDLENDAWGGTGEGAYAIYDHEAGNTFGIDSPEEMVEIYGLLYNRYAIEQENLCPEGWEVPSREDWQELVGYLVDEYGYSNATNDQNGVGEALKVARQVHHPLGGEYDTNEHPRWDGDSQYYGLDRFGFSALPAGVRWNDGEYDSIGQNAYWWSSSEEDGLPMASPYARLVNIQNNLDLFSNIHDRAGLPVRCIKTK